MERLTQKKQPAGYDLVDMQGRTCDLDCRYPEVRDCSNCVLYDAIQKLAHYEELEEQGLLKTVVRGEWKSECGLFFPIYRCSECNCASALGQTKFCPNCGADMRKLKEMDGK